MESLSILNSAQLRRTKDSNLWFAERKAQLTDVMINLTNKSPTVRAELNPYRKYSRKSPHLHDGPVRH
jgi:hypothetical protein